MEVLQLSQVKVSDRGMQHLLHQPLERLSELDLSNTLITSRTLALLPKGKVYPLSRGGMTGSMSRSKEFN